MKHAQIKEDIHTKLLLKIFKIKLGSSGYKWKYNMQIYCTGIGCKYVNQTQQAQNKERSFVNTDIKVQYS